MFNTFTPLHWQDPINIRIADVMMHYPVTTAPSAVEHAGFVAHKASTPSDLDGSVNRIAISEDGQLVYVTFRLNFHHFDRFELDLCGHTQVWGAALSCLRLKLTDVVLI